MAYLSPNRQTNLPREEPAAGVKQDDVVAVGSDTAAKQQDLLATLAEQKRLRSKDLSQSEKNNLKSFTCNQVPGGGLAIYDGGRNIGTIGKDRVELVFTQPPDGRENIEAKIKGSIAYKASFGNEASIGGRPDDIERMMLEKANVLSGIKIDNPSFKTPQDLDAALEKACPGIVKKMETEWTREQAASKPDVTEQFDNRQPVSISGQTVGLITSPIGIDKIQPGMLARNFGPAAQGLPLSVETPAPLSPAPVVTSRPAFG